MTTIINSDNPNNDVKIVTLPDSEFPKSADCVKCGTKIVSKDDMTFMSYYDSKGHNKVIRSIMCTQCSVNLMLGEMGLGLCMSGEEEK